MSASIASIFDGKERSARRTAKLRMREAATLLKRAKSGIGQEHRVEVLGCVGEVGAALKSGRTAEIRKKSERLGALINKNLDGYRKPAWRESMESIGMAVLVALLLRSFVVEAFKIPSGSMIPTLAIGDQIFVNKYIYGMRVPFTSIRLVDFATPERGDVIVFRRPDPPHEDYIKRVIGLPGDEVEVRDGVISINGQRVTRKQSGRETFWDRQGDTGRWVPFHAMTYSEQLGEHSYRVLQDIGALQSLPDYDPQRIPEGHVFVMGDNRDHSFDSRSWGFVPLSNILGRALFVWWSWGEDGLAKDRLGTWID